MSRAILLSPELLLSAYAQGFFPMGEEDTSEIQWFNPDPRAVLPLDRFHCPRSLRRRIARGGYEVRRDFAFRAVMEGCAERESTWITDDFFTAYETLHSLGFAHSMEIWREDRLIGGTYGVQLGAAFFAESKFHRETDASKLALFHLVEHLNRQGFDLLEVQFVTAHLSRLGAVEIPRSQYLTQLAKAMQKDVSW